MRYKIGLREGRRRSQLNAEGSIPVCKKKEDVTGGEETTIRETTKRASKKKKCVGEYPIT